VGRPKTLNRPVTISIRIDEVLAKKARELAKNRKTTVSEIVRAALTNYILSLDEKSQEKEEELYKKIDFREIGLTDEYYYIRDELLEMQRKIEHAIERLNTWPTELILKFKKTLRKARFVLLRMKQVPDYIYNDYDDFKKWANSLWKRKIEVIRRMKNRRAN